MTDFDLEVPMKVFVAVQCKMLRESMPEVPLEDVQLLPIPKTDDNRLFYAGIAVSYVHNGEKGTEVSYGVMMFSESATRELPKGRSPLDVWDYAYSQEVEKHLVPYITGAKPGEKTDARFIGRGVTVLNLVDYNTPEAAQETLRQFTEELIMHSIPVPDIKPA